jgi:hypothetical protein
MCYFAGIAILFNQIEVPQTPVFIHFRLKLIYENTLFSPVIHPLWLFL